MDRLAGRRVRGGRGARQGGRGGLLEEDRRRGQVLRRSKSLVRLYAGSGGRHYLRLHRRQRLHGRRVAEPGRQNQPAVPRPSEEQAIAGFVRQPQGGDLRRRHGSHPGGEERHHGVRAGRRAADYAPQVGPRARHARQQSG